MQSANYLKEPPAALRPAEPLLKYTPVIKVVTEEPRSPVAASQPPSVIGILCRCLSLCTLGLLMSITVCLLYVYFTTPNMDQEGHPGQLIMEGNGMTMNNMDLQSVIAAMPAQQQAQLFDPLDDLTLTFMFHGAAIDSQPFSMCNDTSRVQRGSDIDGEAFITYRTQPGIASFRVQTFFFNPLLLTRPQPMEQLAARAMENASMPQAGLAGFEPFSFLLGDSLGGSWDSIPVEYQQIEALPSGFERGVYVPSRQLPSKDLLKVVLNDVPQDSWRAQVGDVFILSL